MTFRARVGLAITTTPTLFWHVSSDDGNNRTGWKNSRYDALMNEANEQTDLKKREQLFQQAETIAGARRIAHHPALYLRRHQLFRHEQNPGHLPKHSGRSSVAELHKKIRDPGLEMYFLRRELFLRSAAAGHQRAGVWLVHLAPGGPFDRDARPASPEIERNLRRPIIWTNRSGNNTCATLV
jgi:hypothetical protein